MSQRNRKKIERWDPSHSPKKASNMSSNDHEDIENSSREKAKTLGLDPSAGICPGADQEGFYFAEEVLGRRQKSNGSWEYKIRWKGYDARHDTWEPLKNLNECLKHTIYERYTLKKRAPLEVTPEQQVEVDRAVAESKKYTDKRNEKLRKRGLPLDYYAYQSEDDTVSTEDETYDVFDKDYNPDDVELNDLDIADDALEFITHDDDIHGYEYSILTEQTPEYPTTPHNVTPDTNRAPFRSGKMYRRPPNSISRGKYVSDNSSGWPSPQQTRAILGRGKAINSDGSLAKSSRRVSSRRVSNKTSMSSDFRSQKSKTNAPRRDKKKKSTPMEVAIRKKITQIAKRSKTTPTNCGEERIRQIETILDMLNVLLEESGFCEQNEHRYLQEQPVEAVNGAVRDVSYIAPDHCVVPRDRDSLGNPIDTAQKQIDAFDPSNNCTSDNVDFNVLDEETNTVARVAQDATSEGLKDPSLGTATLHETAFQKKQQVVHIYDSDIDSDDDIDDQAIMEGYLTQEEETSNYEENFVPHSDSKTLYSYQSARENDSESDTGW